MNVSDHTKLLAIPCHSCPAQCRKAAFHKKNKKDKDWKLLENFVSKNENLKDQYGREYRQHENENLEGVTRQVVGDTFLPVG